MAVKSICNKLGCKLTQATFLSPYENPTSRKGEDPSHLQVSEGQVQFLNLSIIGGGKA